MEAVGVEGFCDVRAVGWGRGGGGRGRGGERRGRVRNEEGGGDLDNSLVESRCRGSLLTTGHCSHNFVYYCGHGKLREGDRSY